MTNEDGGVLQFVNLMPPEAIEFFATFSRAEYTLKRHGYCFMRGGQLVVDWNRFADEMPMFVQAIRQHGFAQTLLDTPPKKQIIDQNGLLDWQDAQPIGENIRRLFEMIRRVRNNLFHGGKFHADLNTDTSRSVNLLRESTWVIYRAIDGHPNHAIRETFRMV
jgi:hypothetical protein